MSEESILTNDKLSALFYQKGKDDGLCVGVPHHVSLGVTQLPCFTHSDSDENAGLIGYKLSKKLKCSFVIACNYYFDSNKCNCSDYYKIIDIFSPKILIEIHGHGGKKANFDIEISCGSKSKSSSAEKFADILRTQLPEEMKGYSISGNFEKIYFKAANTTTINTNNWLGVHIELLKKLRSSMDENFLNALQLSIESFRKEISSSANI